jgi:hypothetical protein
MDACGRIPLAEGLVDRHPANFDHQYHKRPACGMHKSAMCHAGMCVELFEPEALCQPVEVGAIEIEFTRRRCPIAAKTRQRIVQ